MRGWLHYWPGLVSVFISPGSPGWGCACECAGRGQARLCRLTAGELWEAPETPGTRAQERALSPEPDTLIGEILWLPSLIRTPWAVEVVTRETCDSIRLTLRHQKYLDFNHHHWLFYKLCNWKLVLSLNSKYILATGATCDSSWLDDISQRLKFVKFSSFLRVSSTLAVLARP